MREQVLELLAHQAAAAAAEGAADEALRVHRDAEEALRLASGPERWPGWHMDDVRVVLLDEGPVFLYQSAEGVRARRVPIEDLRAEVLR